MSATTFIPEWTTADRLRKAREAACMDQLELAERIGKLMAKLQGAQA
jgi:transcriptional regulator with XRE-family HTH domain